MPAQDTTTGTTIAFGTSSWSADFTGVSFPGWERGSQPTSHLGTTSAHTFIARKLVDYGEMNVELAYDSDNVDSNGPPIDAAAETVTVTWPIPSGMSNGATFAFTGFMTNFSITGTLEEKITASATVKISGEITFGDAS